jgi:hypothetical protein
MRVIKKRNKILAILVVSFFLITFSAINMGVTSNKALKTSDATILEQKNQFLKSSAVIYNWSSIEVISTGSVNNSANPEILADNSGNLYVVWDEENFSDYNDRDVIFKLWNASTSSWENNETVSKNLNLTSRRPDIAFYLNDLYVVWQDEWDNINSEDILYTHRIPSGMWVIIKNLTKPNPSQIKEYPSICIGQDLSIHIVWAEQNVSNSDDYDIYYSKNFLTYERITNNSDGKATNPQIICDSDGNPHIVWEEFIEATFSINIRHIWYNGGWDAIDTISPSASLSESKNSKLALDSSGNVHVVWYTHAIYPFPPYDSYNIYHRVWNRISDTWNPMNSIVYAKLPNLHPDIAIDTLDNIHIVYDDEPSAPAGDRDIYYKNYLNSTSSWSVAQCVVNGTESALNPSITTDTNDIIHIVWEDLSNLNNSGVDKDIFYRGLNLTIEIEDNGGGFPLFILPSAEKEQIPGYDLLILIGAISVISMIIMKRYTKNI